MMETQYFYGHLTRQNHFEETGYYWVWCPQFGEELSVNLKDMDPVLVPGTTNQVVIFDVNQAASVTFKKTKPKPKPIPKDRDPSEDPVLLPKKKKPPVPRFAKSESDTDSDDERDEDRARSPPVLRDRGQTVDYREVSQTPESERQIMEHNEKVRAERERDKAAKAAEVPLPESDSESDRDVSISYDARTSRETSRLPEDIHFESGFMELSRSRSPSPSPPREVSLHESQERGVSESEFAREINERMAALNMPSVPRQEDEKTPFSDSDESEDEPILPAVDPDFVISPPKTLMEDAAETKGEQVGTMIVVGLIFLAAANYLT